jgi:tetratricopeptide (TPR) repeat protein
MKPGPVTGSTAFGFLLAVCIVTAEPIPVEPSAASEAPRPGQTITDNEELHQLHLKGIRQALNWEYEEAKKTFEEVISRDPDQPAGEFFRGALLLVTIQYLDPGDIADKEVLVCKYFENAIEKADKLLAKDPRDFQANFFKGAAHGFRGLFRLQQLKILAAAADARIAKHYMDLALKENPEFYDTYLGLGCYNYYVDALPALIKFLKSLLFIPPGNRRLGLEQLELAIGKGVYCPTFAKIVLASIYRNFESDPEKALKLESEYLADCPDHPWYALENGTLHVYLLVNYRGAEPVYEKVLQRAEAGQPHFQGEIRAIAKYRLAQVKFFNLKPAEAIADLKALVEENPKEPKEILAGAHLLWGQILLALGDRGEGREHLRTVKSLPDSRTYRHERMDNRVIIPKQESLHTLASQWLEQPANPNKEDAYRLFTEGFAFLRSGRLDEARREFDQALSVRPACECALFGVAETLARSGQHEEALALFSDLAKGLATDPAWLLREARFRSGLLHDRLGRRKEALKLYGTAIKAKGGNYFVGLAAKRAIKEENAWSEIGWPDI